MPVFGTGNKTRTCTVAHWNLNPTCLPIPPYPHILLGFPHRPVAVPDIFVGFQKPSSSVDRGHSLRSLHPPQAALPSLPNSTIPAYIVRLSVSACCGAADIAVLPGYFITGQNNCQRHFLSVEFFGTSGYFFAYFSLTFPRFTGKIYLGIVYAGKYMVIFPRFIDNRRRLGYAFCAKWRCLFGFTGPFGAEFQLQIAHWSISPTPFAYAILVKEVRLQIWIL